MLQIVIFGKDVTVIFKDLIEETLLKVSKFINNNKVLVRFAGFALVSVIALVISIITCGITVGFNVEYSGENIAVVKNTSVFDTAKDKVIDCVGSGECEVKIEKPKFSLSVTTKDSLYSETALADAIIENTDGISFSSALTVNGKVLAYADRKELDNLVNTALCKYYVKGAENNSTFVDDVEVVEGYCLSEDIKSSEQVNELVSELKVKTVSTVTSETEVKYSTKTVYTSKQERGYQKVKTKGEKGLKTETAVVETVNGKETAKTVISRKVLKEPVQKVVVKGTAVPMASATARAKAKSAGFICPMNKSSIKMISAYWGDGRGHKAIDFAGDTGSPIFAAKAGKVTFSGWDGNYGYAVVIDHGNGYQTRYAHASALCVKKGQTVSQGQQVARLGNTGRSTGPHLHFEILKNGNQVNPAPYIGY